MYYHHYGFIENPFGLSPDPRFLFLSDGHREALATLYYGITEGRGFIVLSGPPGTGKTLLLNTLTAQAGHRWKLITVPGDPLLSFEDLQFQVLDKLGGTPSHGASGFQVKMQIGQALAAEDGRGRKVVLVVDEAQTLSAEVLEQVRLLSNFETPERKLLQIVLVGQPGLVETINRQELFQLKQRVGLWCSLQPLSRKEVSAYIRARLATAGRKADGPFTRSAEERVAALSQGIPRLINLLCDNALLVGFAEGVDRIEPQIVSRAASELSGVLGGADGRSQPPASVPLNGSPTSEALPSGAARMSRGFVAGSPPPKAPATMVEKPRVVEEAQPISSLLSGTSAGPKQGENHRADSEGFQPEPLPAPKPGSETSPLWAASPSLERLQRQFDEQIRAIEQVKRLLEERLRPFPTHVRELRRCVDEALKQLEVRLKPLRQYLEGQRDSLDRVSMQKNMELKDEFDPVSGFLADQRRMLERAHLYLEEQPRSLTRYLEAQEQAVEEVFSYLKEMLDPFGRHLSEEQKLLEAIAEARLTDEFQAVASYCGQRQAALGRYATGAEFRPQALFAELDGIYEKHKGLNGGRSSLLARMLEQTRQADLRLRDALKPSPHERDEARPSTQPSRLT